MIEQGASATPIEAPTGWTGSRLFFWLLGLACLLPLVPLMIYPVVPGSDYMMHVARASIELRSNSPFYRDILTFDPVILPNLAVDFLIPLLSRAMPVIVAGRVFVGLSFVLQMTGALALMYAVQRRITPAAFLIPLVCYNLVTGWGFLGFMLGTGLALWGLAAGILMDRRPVALRLIVAVAFALMLYFCHLAAFGLFVFSSGLYQLLRRRFTPEERPAARTSLLILLASCVLPAYVHLFKSSIGKSVGMRRNGPFMWLNEFLSFLNPYFSWPYWTLWMTAFFLVVLGLATRRLRIDRHLGFVALGMYVLYMVTPHMIYGSFFASTRLLPFAAFVFLASLRVEGTESRRVAVASVAGALVVAQTAIVLISWHGMLAYREPMLRGARQAPPGTLFVTMSRSPDWFNAGMIHRALVDKRWQPNVDHVGDEVALLGDYYPLQISLQPGKQPVNVRPSYYNIYLPTNSSGWNELSQTTLAAFDRASPAQKDVLLQALEFRPLNASTYVAQLPAFLAQISRDYRKARRASGIYPNAGVYVIYFHRGHPANPLPDLLREVTHDEGMTNVYEVRDL